jgi:2,4-diaminopentanoate dehydrogenase
MKKIRVIQYGLGPIGCAVARLAAKRKNLQIVGGVDIDPKKVGQDMGEVIGLNKKMNVFVAGSLAEVLKKTSADVVLHTTSSYFDLFENQILEILEAGLDIVSTAEELSFPYQKFPEKAEKINAAAKKAGKSVVGTGINPGFLMDSLPLNLTALCQEVKKIDIVRTINASTRRGPFQAKIGVGMNLADFNKKMSEGRMGHVGLPESMAMLFDSLGHELTKYEDSVEAVIAEKNHKSAHFEVPTGKVIGLKQIAQGFDKKGEFVRLTFIAQLDAKKEQDVIKIKGTPNLTIQLKGTNGDLGTVAIAVNTVKRIHEAPSGLWTMRDLPIVFCG